MSHGDWQQLLALAGEYAGQGRNHEGQAYHGQLRLIPCLGGRGLRLEARATSATGEVFHEEQSTLAPLLEGGVGLWVLSTNHPTLAEHRLDPAWPGEPGARTWSFRLGDPERRDAFREVVSLDLWPDGSLTHRYAWGLPGGELAPRSGARLSPLRATGVAEAPLAPAREGTGLVPHGPGWFVVNVRDAHWQRSAWFGAWCAFEGGQRFEQVGVNVHVLLPGRPSCHYHGEADQEDFLVLQGECLLVIEGQERRLRAGDFVHCPPWTRHVLVGAEAPCAVLMLGARARSGVFYPLDEAAQRRGACPAHETASPEESYAGSPPVEDATPGWTP